MARRWRNDDPNSGLIGTPTLSRDMRLAVLNVSYGTKGLKAVCTRIEEAQAQLGPGPAAELHELLAEAESFLTATELIDFRGGEISGGETLSFSFGSRHWAVFKAVGKDLPRDEDGSVAWRQVRRIVLIEIS